MKSPITRINFLVDVCLLISFTVEFNALTLHLRIAAFKLNFYCRPRYSMVNFSLLLAIFHFESNVKAEKKKKGKMNCRLSEKALLYWMDSALYRISFLSTTLLSSFREH